MHKDQFKKQVAELLLASVIPIQEECTRIIDSSKVDISIYRDDSYALAKVILCLAMENAATWYRPLHSEGLLDEILNARKQERSVL